MDIRQNGRCRICNEPTGAPLVPQQSLMSHVCPDCLGDVLRHMDNSVIGDAIYAAVLSRKHRGMLAMQTGQVEA